MVRTRALAVAGIALLMILGACTDSGSKDSQDADTFQGEVIPWETSLEPWGEFTLAPHILEKVQNGEELRFALLSSYSEGPVWASIVKGLQDGARAYGVEVQFVSPQLQDVPTLISNIRSVLQSDPDGIAIFPTDLNALTPLINEALDDGVPTLAFNIDAPGSNRLAYIGVDNFSYGAAVGNAWFEHPDFRPGEIILLSGDADAQYTKERVAGLESVAPAGVTFTTPQTTTYEIPTAVGVVDAAIKANPDAVGIYGADDIPLIAAGTWAEQNDAAGEYFIGGHNIPPPVLQKMADGYIQAAVSQNPYRQGFSMVAWLATYVRGGGEKICVFCDAGFFPVTSSEQASELLDSNCAGRGCA